MRKYAAHVLSKPGKQYLKFASCLKVNNTALLLPIEAVVLSSLLVCVSGPHPWMCVSQKILKVEEVGL